MAILIESLANVAFEISGRVCELNSNGCKDLASSSKISAASREEEACSKASSLIVFAGDGAGDGGFTRPGHTVQPKDAFFVISVSPLPYSCEDIDSGVREAPGCMLLVGGIKCCLSSTRQQLEEITAVLFDPAIQTVRVSRAS